MNDAPNATTTTVTRAPVEPSEAHVLVVEDNVPNFVLIGPLAHLLGSLPTSNPTLGHGGRSAPGPPSRRRSQEVHTCCRPACQETARIVLHPDRSAAC